ncbi:MFS transporter [Nocardioides mangrovicus]|uniref:MFS transporter n=1 Tax=Nocardioides mangrovicus TaxID=2478913 RepID=A0A3L8P535_9ACTN|nr:MFS transporter [Nocardioides mangrovicus]RLV50335.1 MFS transporter [Nocardioides mangrovicus]
MTASTSSGAEPADSRLRHDTTPGRANVELLVVGLGALVVSLSQSVLVPVLGELNEEFGASASWLLTSTLLVAAVSVPIMGRLGDMFGKRLMLLVAMGALTVGSLIDALSHQLAWLIVGRALQGAAGAAIPLGISLLATLLPREKAGSGIALISAMLGVGGALGLPLAGFVAQNWDYHALFWINTVVGAIAFVGIAALVPESRQRAGGRVDLVGAVLLAAGLVCLILPLEQSHAWGWTSLRVPGLLVLSALIFAVFAAIELRQKEPLVDLAALRRRPILLTNIASICFGFALFASLLGTATFVEAGRWTGYGFGSSLLVGGLTMLPSGLAMLVFSPVAARLIDRYGGPRVLALGALVVAAGWLVRIVLTDHLWQVIVGATVVGIGTGIGYASIPSIINAFTPSHEIAAANGLNTLFRSLGSTLATAAGTSILASSIVYHVVDGKVVGGASSLTAYRWLFAACAVAAVLAALLVVTIRRDDGEAAATSAHDDLVSAADAT